MPDLAYLRELLLSGELAGPIQFVVITFLVYQLLKLVRRPHEISVAIGIVALAVLVLLADWLQLTVLQVVLRVVLQVSPLAIVAIFWRRVRER